MDRFSPNQVPTYLVEHLATFSTTTPQHEHITPRMALQRLFKMEKTSGIWTQRMAIQLKANHMWILDGETNDVVERFPVALIQQPTSFNDQNHIYNNILIFTVQLPNEPQGELHIFQCVSHEAVNVVDDIYQWMRHYGCGSGSSGSASGSPSGANGGGGPADKSTAGAASSSSAGGAVPSSNVNVKEAVTVFNQIAAQREKKGASTDNLHHLANSSDVRGGGGGHHQDVDSDASSFAESTGNNHRANHDIGEGYSNERYVSILNHCFDDIERFIIRLQHAAAAMRELQIRSHKRGAKGSGDGLLAIRARGPSEEEFFEILSKFKLAFNLLAKLKGCIHDPNAPELVHFLFTPLAIIIEAARSNEPPVDPSLVGVPYLNSEAIELLANCCTSKEYDLWQSLGINWIQPVKPFRLSSPYQPVFIDGWAPSITEPELIGFVGSSASESDGQDSDEQLQLRPQSKHSRDLHHHHQQHRAPPQYVPGDDSDDYEEQGGHGHNLGPVSSQHVARGSPSTSHSANHHGHHHRLGATGSPSPLESLERDQSPHLHPQDGIDPEQLDWLAELQARGAKVVRVLFPRTANNNKELTVVRGEILEILDDSRKWWKARNSRGQVAHVPHTIVGEMEHGGGGGVAGAGVVGVGGGIGATAAIPAGSDGSDGWSVRERQVELVPVRQFNQQQDGLLFLQTSGDSGNERGSRPLEQSAPAVQPVQPVQPAPEQAPAPALNASKVMIVTTTEAAKAAAEVHLRHTSLVNRGGGASSSSSSSEPNLKNSFEKELTATVKQTVVERQVSTQRSKSQDNFMARFAELSEDSFSSTDLLQMLRHKDFPENLIAAIENSCQADAAFPKKVLNACKDSKKALRNLIPVEVADEKFIQKLYSNLLIVKNTMKPPGMDNELKHALSRRQEAIATG